MARTIVRGTPYTKSSSAREGIAPGTPKGMDGQTTPQQYRGTGMSTAQSARGTPYQSQAGNGPEARRVVSADRYGKVVSGSAGNLNDPKSNGDGVVLDSVSSDYEDPTIRPSLDSPVPGSAPMFQTSEILSVNQARLGKGMPAAAARDDILNLGGVMSRGMLGTSKPGAPETELTNDDTLPAVAPAR